jgi:hypothetical protein
MKRCAGALLAILIFLLPLTAAGRLVRVVGTSKIWTGTYTHDDPSQNATGRCPATGCVGDLVRCGPTESIKFTKRTFSFVARVCDDRDDSLPPCAGRMTALAEECVGPDDVIIKGSMATVHSAGEIRFCVDSGDCTGPAPDSVVGYGTISTQTRLGAGSVEASAMSSIVAKGTKDTRFLFEGKRVRFFHGRRLVDFITVEPNFGVRCGDGCAVAGISVTDQT